MFQAWTVSSQKSLQAGEARIRSGKTVALLIIKDRREERRGVSVYSGLAWTGYK